MSEGGIPITDPVELAWCDYARKREERGFRIEMQEQGVSVSSFKAGATWERLRIRRELLEALDAWTGGAHPSSLRGAVATDLHAALDRICGKEE